MGGRIETAGDPAGRPLGTRPGDRLGTRRALGGRLSSLEGASLRWRPVRHAGSESLDQLEPLIRQLRTVPGLVERSRGVFYRRSKPFLHFHEDPSGLYADLRVGDEFERFPVGTGEERARLMAQVRGR